MTEEEPLTNYKTSSSLTQKPSTNPSVAKSNSYLSSQSNFEANQPSSERERGKISTSSKYERECNSSDAHICGSHPRNIPSR